MDSSRPVRFMYSGDNARFHPWTPQYGSLFWGDWVLPRVLLRGMFHLLNLDLITCLTLPSFDLSLSQGGLCPPPWTPSFMAHRATYLVQNTLITTILALKFKHGCFYVFTASDKLWTKPPMNYLHALLCSLDRWRSIPHCLQYNYRVPSFEWSRHYRS